MQKLNRQLHPNTPNSKNTTSTKIPPQSQKVARVPTFIKELMEKKKYGLIKKLNKNKTKIQKVKHKVD